MTSGDWRDDGFTERPPSPETLAWVAASSGSGGRVVDHRRLTGGVCSAVHRVTVDRAGRRSAVILRQYPGGFGLEQALEAELAHLAVVAGSGLPVPTVLAADVAGEATGGAPAMLMTELPGEVELDPADPAAWRTEIAEVTVRLHALDLPAPPLRPWTDSWIAPLEALRVPTGARRPEVWRAAFEAMTTAPPEPPAVFLHCDLLPVNLLWSGGRITGLTDWNGIRRGARAVDVGHTRRYLAAVFSPEWAEDLGARYAAITGVPLDPWWDLWALLHWDDQGPKWIGRQVAGRRSIDPAGMTARVETVVEAALRRLG